VWLCLKSLSVFIRKAYKEVSVTFDCMNTFTAHRLRLLCDAGWMCVYRSPVAKFLLEGGQTQSWLLGNSIISVTTSGGARVGRSGLCEKCLSVARAGSGGEPPMSAGHDDACMSAVALRRRHKSEAVKTCRGEDGSVGLLRPLSTISQDDIGLHRRPSCTASEPGPVDSMADDVELMRLDAKKKAMDDVLISMTFCYSSVSKIIFL